MKRWTPALALAPKFAATKSAEDSNKILGQGYSQSASKSELVARVEKAAREAMGVEGGSAGAEAEDEDGSDRGGFSDGSGSGSDDDVPKGRPDWFDACLY